MIVLNENLNQLGRLKALIHTYARRYQLNPQLIAGIVYVESGGNPNAVRFEPKFFERVKSLASLNGYTPKNCSLETERVLRSCSFGLMQIMGETARGRGFRGEFLSDLLEPELNLDMGVAYFAELYSKAQEDSRVALFYYNAGPAAKYPGIKTNDYPTKVLNAINDGMTQGLV